MNALGDLPLPALLWGIDPTFTQNQKVLWGPPPLPEGQQSPSIHKAQAGEEER